MSKKVSESQKKDIINAFKGGAELKDISLNFDFTIPTIVRQLKNILGKDEFERIKTLKHKKKEKVNYASFKSQFDDKDKKEEDASQNYKTDFFEIPPLDEEINLENQREVSSELISEVILPNIVFMIVSNTIEIYTKHLKDYPDWQFLPVEDLERQTLEIFSDIKLAKRSCRKDQKVIKVPNTEVFKIVAPILRARGISRIISDNKLIAL